MKRRTFDEIQEILKRRPIVLDGAMGTTIQAKGVSPSCNEELNLSNPDLIRDIHLEYLSAGSDVILANTFGASSISLGDHDLADRSIEINRRAVEIAKSAITSCGKQAFVAGDIGPTSKLPTLLHTSFDVLFGAYFEQMYAMLDCGADLILIETCQDPLQIKAALSAAQSSFIKVGFEVPVLLSITIERIGTMLLGTELDAALSVAAPYKPFAFGLNCATGPEAMREHLNMLSNESPFHLLCEPNAGIPRMEGGQTKYDMGPEEFSEIVAGFVERFGISFVGGCCGTTPEYIKALHKILGKQDGTKLKDRGAIIPSVSSLFTSVSLDQEPKPLIIAEQTNVNGSRKFKKLLLANDYESMAEVAKSASASSHVLDICLAQPGRDEPVDYTELIRSIALKVDSPIMIDSTNVGAIEAALKLVPGRAIINSINLEDGGKKAKTIIGFAKKYGAAIVGLVIDEDGMAKTADRKIKVAKRIIDLVNSEGLGDEDILIDYLTFTLASGDASLNDAGLQTFEAITQSKANFPNVGTMLGVSNISFGLPPRFRKALTSVFLHKALDAGLDAAIVNPQRIVPYDGISEDLEDICSRLIDNDRDRGDPLKELLGYSDGDEEQFVTTVNRKSLSPEEALRENILEGTKEGLASIIDNVIAGGREPSQIINEILLPSMQEVGVSFGDGGMPLPFVLESAETMKAAIDILTPRMKDGEVVSKGTIVLATVRGDVHDIGKNLVDAILRNNGFKVINLGIRQPAKSIVDAVRANSADAIGLSGLLVSSTEVMLDDLKEFREEGLSIPVLCGGAALSLSFVKEFLHPAYGSDVFYCEDAFAGFRAMQQIVS
ncbi:MAG: dihydropteroate synthase [Deltaproteobacteria bacterium]|jgi:5-methyltetrahydrofolate--homocysteine methyltransferase|nr:dihydropteroate synthase [Deltaproteobacteria bacterium]